MLESIEECQNGRFLECILTMVPIMRCKHLTGRHLGNTLLLLILFKVCSTV